MRTECPEWPAKVMGSKWKVWKTATEETMGYVRIYLEATGHTFVKIGFDCELSEPKAREVAQHIVDLHNASLRG